MNLLKEHKAFLFVLISCLVLRFIPLFDYQFTFDELSGLDRTQFDSFAELIRRGVEVDAHPPFVQVLIYYLVRWFGYVTWIVKLPFLLFSIGAMVYAYALGLKGFSKNVGLLSSVFVGFSLIFVFYSPIARMYISGVFFSLGLLFYFFRVTFLNQHKWTNYFFLGLFAWLCAINQHMNALFAATVIFSGFQFLKSGTRGKYLLTCFLILLAYAPVIPITLHQIGHAGIGYEQGGWLDKPEPGAIFSFIKVFLGTGRSYMVVLFFCALYFIFNQGLAFTRKQVFLVSLFLINYLIIYLYSIYRAPIFQNSVMLFAGTALLLFFCSLMDFKNPGLYKLCFATILALLVFKTYFRKDYFHQCVKTTFEYQFERTFYYKDKYGDKNVYPLLFDADEVMKKIYFTKYGRTFDCKIASDSMISYGNRTFFSKPQKVDGDTAISSVKLFSDFVVSLKCEYVAMSSSTPLYEGIVQEYFPYILENTQTQGVYYKLYSRKKEDAAYQVANDSLPFYFDAFNHYRAVSKLLPRIESSGRHDLDSASEFPYGRSFAYEKINPQEGQMLFAKAIVEAGYTRPLLELCIHTSHKKGESFAYSSKVLSDFKSRDTSTILYCEQFIGTRQKKIKDSVDVAVYFWNRGKQNYKLRGLEFMLVDYWRQKWHYWE